MTHACRVQSKQNGDADYAATPAMLHACRTLRLLCDLAQQYRAITGMPLVRLSLQGLHTPQAQQLLLPNTHSLGWRSEMRDITKFKRCTPALWQHVQSQDSL